MAGLNAFTPFGYAVGGLGHLVGGAMEMAGGMAKMASNSIGALGEAAKAMNDEKAPQGTVNQTNLGIIATAAKQKVAVGTGSLPNLSTAVAKPAMNAKMPSEKLLGIAVKYLESIDNTLKQQLTNQVQANRDQQSAIREQEIESGDNQESRLKKFLSEKKDLVATKISDNASFLKSAAVAGLAAAALKVASMDTKQIDELIKTISDFEKNNQGLITFFKFLASGAAGAAFLRMLPIVGKRLGPLGFAAGLVTQGLIDLGVLDGGSAKDIALGFGGSAIALAITKRMLKGKTAAAATAIKTGVKAAIPAAVSFARRVGGLATTVVPSAIELGGEVIGGIRGIAKGSPLSVAIMKEYLKKAPFSRLLIAMIKKGPRWEKFVLFLAKAGGKKYAERLAFIAAFQASITAAEASAAATGIGALPAGVVAAIEKTISLGFTVWTLWELYSLWQEWEKGEGAEKVNAKAAVPPDASKAATSSSTATAPAATKASSAEASNVPDTAYDIVLGYGRYGRPEDYYDGRKLTQLTVAEVIEFGKNVLQPNSKADGLGRLPSGELVGDSGVGAYATNRTTIQGAIDAGIISPSDIYDKAAQDKVARWLYNLRNKQGNLHNTWAHFQKTGERSSSMTFEQAQPLIMAGEGTSGRSNNASAASTNGSGKGILATGAEALVKGIQFMRNTFAGATATNTTAIDYGEYQKSANVDRYAQQLKEYAKSDAASVIAGMLGTRNKENAMLTTTPRQRMASAFNSGTMTTMDPNFPFNLYPEIKDIVIQGAY